MKWEFRVPPPDGGRDYGDAAGFAFNEGLRVFTREVAQNAGDAKLDDEGSIDLELSVIELTGAHLADFLEEINWDDLRPHLEAARDLDEAVQTSHAIKEGLHSLDSGTLHLIRVADYRTTGLLGDERGKSRFAAVMRNTLDSDKGKQTAGGSFGLGKSVMWASSRFSLVLSCSNLSESYQGLSENRTIGRLELPWHSIHGAEFAGPAWLGRRDDATSNAESHWATAEETDHLQLARPPGRSGTSFLIVAAYDTSGEATTIDQMADELERGLVDSFWPSMVDRPESGPLMNAVVRVERNGQEVDRRVVDPREHAPARVELLERHYAGNYSDELVEYGDTVLRRPILQVPRKKDQTESEQDHDAALLVGLADPTNPSDEPLNRIAYMRGKLMVVKEVPVRGLPVGAPSFHAIVLAGSAAAEGSDDIDARAAEIFLRAAEPPEHNDWKATSKVTNVYARGAKTNLRTFFGNVQSEIRSLLSPTDRRPDDGPEALKELLQIVMPPPSGERKPRVSKVSGEVNSDGAWEVTVTVTCPPDPKTQSWSLVPELRFAVQSGAGIKVPWAKLQAGRNCEIDSSGRLRSVAGKKTIEFTGLSDVTNHPADSTDAVVQVALAKVTNLGVSNQGGE